MKISQKYVKESFTDIDDESCDFLFRQSQRMPDYYRFGLNLILVVFYMFRIPYQKLGLLNKLFQSLTTFKKYESLEDD
jgi:hypothetical protein